MSTITDRHDGTPGADAPRDEAHGDGTAPAVAEVTAAVERAARAQAAWRRLPAAERARHLLAVRTAFLDRLDEVVTTVVEETGKLAAEVVMNEALIACEILSYYAKHGPRLLRPERVSTGLLFANKNAEKRHEPLGVVGVISPWNYPVVLSLGPVVTALMAGNAAVLKPSEVTPRTGLLLGEIIAGAGGGAWPDLVPVVTGDGLVGDALVRSDVAKISFTGSVATGRKVMAAAAESPKPVLLELGGKDPMIVCADADLERAARAAVWGGYTNCGQTCIAVERVYVVADVYDEFVAKVREHTRGVRQGAGPDHDVGAVVNEDQLHIIEEHLRDAVEHGATVAEGGEVVLVGGRRSLAPTVLLDVEPSMAAMREETFGPLLPVMKVRDADEALRLANDSPLGLSASVWGKDEATLERLVDGLEAGSVCVNDVIMSFAVPGLPFGGVKQSGFGRSHGPEGLYEYTQTKSVVRDRTGFSREPMWLPLPRHVESLARLAMKLRYRRR